MRIPSKIECFKLINEMDMMDHIISHSILVSHVAVLLADSFAEIGVNINRDLVRASALLHDITKTRSFQTKENHALTGGQWLQSRGYPEVGAIVRQHVLLDSYLPANSPNEAEIVNYADKRVLHDKIASLKERMQYILKRYGTIPDYSNQIRRLWVMSENLEKRLFQKLSFSPDTLSRNLDSGKHTSDIIACQQL
ncbi:MAG: HDIG domain-containing protein [Desulfobacterales bacterium]|nr:HDIG domain-containing protein [Desulfobacterales bacterium]